MADIQKHKICQKIKWDREACGLACPFTNGNRRKKAERGREKLVWVRSSYTAANIQQCKKIPPERRSAEIRGLIETYGQKADFTDVGSLSRIIGKL